MVIYHSALYFYDIFHIYCKSHVVPYIMVLET